MSQFFTSGGQRTGLSSFHISPSNEHPGLISFRVDRLDLLAVQRTLRSLPQHHSSKPLQFTFRKVKYMQKSAHVINEEFKEFSKTEPSHGTRTQNENQSISASTRSLQPPPPRGCHYPDLEQHVFALPVFVSYINPIRQ